MLVLIKLAFVFCKFFKTFICVILILFNRQGSHLQWLSLLLPHPHTGLPVQDGKEDEIEDEDI